MSLLARMSPGGVEPAHVGVPTFAASAAGRRVRFRVWVSFPACRPPRPRDESPFGVHVGHVVERCAEEQVFRVTAGPNITAVEHEQSSRDSTVDQLPGEAVHKVSAVIATTQPHLSVADAIQRSLPQPAPTVWFGRDESPDAFLPRDGLRSGLRHLNSMAG